MSNNLFGFKSKKERDDFYIALVVVILFFLLFWWMFLKNGKLDVDGAEASLNGIATTEITDDKVLDADGDGVADSIDNCPEIAGVPENDGCPNDADGDGIADAKDKCPDLAGLIENGGCPKDSDGDGVYDDKDACPNISWNSPSGCPPDTDGDGVFDPNDKCPEEAGSKMNDGCPMITKEEKNYLLEIQNIEFVRGKANISPNSKTKLERLVQILNDRSQASLSIQGHTDNQTGTAEGNLKLSSSRANACKAFLISKGIKENRINAKGFGQSRPLRNIDQSTEAGRKKNRRVEFKINY